MAYTNFRGYSIRFYNPIIPTQNFVQSRDPEGYIWHPTSRAYFQSRKLALILLLNPESRASNKGNHIS